MAKDCVAITDDAAIHSGTDVEPLPDLLWNFEVDGRPLQILTLSFFEEWLLNE